MCLMTLFERHNCAEGAITPAVLKGGPLLSGWQPEPGLPGMGEGGQEVVVTITLCHCGPSFMQCPLPLLPGRRPRDWVEGVHSNTSCS